MPKVHVLDIYPHTGDRSCLGCVEVTGSEAAGEAGQNDGAPLSPRRSRTLIGKRGHTRPVQAAPSPTAEVKKMLVNARWDRTRAAPGDKVGLRAQTVGIAEGTAARLCIFPRGIDDAIAEIQTRVKADAIATSWVPGEDDAALASEFEFEVECDGEAADSDLLRLADFVDVTVRDDEGVPLARIGLALLLGDGTRHETTTDAAGNVRLDGVASGRFEGLTLRLPEEWPDGEPVAAGDFDHEVTWSPGVTGPTGRRVLITYARIDAAAQAATLVRAAEAGVPFCEECAKLAARRAAKPPKDFVDVTVLDDEGQPLAAADVALRLPDGTRFGATTDDAGHLRMDDTVPGQFQALSVVAPPRADSDAPDDSGAAAGFDVEMDYAPGVSAPTGQRVLLVYARTDAAQQAAALSAAAATGTPFCAECARRAAERAGAGAPA